MRNIHEPRLELSSTLLAWLVSYLLVQLCIHCAELTLSELRNIASPNHPPACYYPRPLAFVDVRCKLHAGANSRLSINYVISMPTQRGDNWSAPPALMLITREVSVSLADLDFSAALRR